MTSLIHHDSIKIPKPEGLKQRDTSLDLLKGIACVLMVFAHSTGIENSPLTSIFLGETSKVIRIIYHLGETAPVLFFAVSGIAGYLQAKKYGIKSVSISYFFLFFLGFSYNGITQRNFYGDFEFEILQIIAVGAFLVFCIQYLNKPLPVVFLVIGCIIFLMKLSLDHFSWIKDQLVFIEGIILPPGTFPLLPWLFLFFLGVYAYIASNKYNLLLASVSMGAFIILEILSLTGKLPIDLQPTNKWDMSLGYFLLSCFLLFSTFYLTRKFNIDRLKYISQIILFWGETSLLFLFIHKFVIRVLQRSSAWNSFLFAILKNPIIFYVLVLLFTTFIMKLILRIKTNTFVSSIFSDIRAWMVLVVLVLIVPLITKDGVLIYSLELIFGAVFATYYSSLRKSIKQLDFSRDHTLSQESPT